jgi:hypothetical protein
MPVPDADSYIAASFPGPESTQDIEAQEMSTEREPDTKLKLLANLTGALGRPKLTMLPSPEQRQATDQPEKLGFEPSVHITFGKDVRELRSDSTLYIPPPRERDQGKSTLQRFPGA